jgi:hypothetical protein
MRRHDSGLVEATQTAETGAMRIESLEDSYLALPDGAGPHPGVVVIHEASGLNENIDELWGGDWFGSSKTLDVHVARLRARLEEDLYITTIRRVGFRFATDGDLAD